MKAKFIYEELKDILKPKLKKDIEREIKKDLYSLGLVEFFDKIRGSVNDINFKNLSLIPKNILPLIFQFIQKLNSDPKFHITYIGHPTFVTYNQKKYLEVLFTLLGDNYKHFLIRQYEDSNYIVFVKKYGKVIPNQIKSWEEFLKIIADPKTMKFINEKLEDLLKGKSKKEIIKNLPHNFERLVQLGREYEMPDIEKVPLIVRFFQRAEKEGIPATNMVLNSGKKLKRIFMGTCNLG